MSQSAIAEDLTLARRGLRRIEYDALVEAGLLDDEPVELLEGVLTVMVPQGPRHADIVSVLNRHLSRHLPEPWIVRVQSPLAAGEASEPEPDLAVTTRTPSEHPRTAALVVEVAVSSRRLDLVHKPRVYAAAGVEQYWVVDVTSREIVVHTDPGPRGYGGISRVPWSSPLTVLGVTVRLERLVA